MNKIFLIVIGTFVFLGSSNLWCPKNSLAEHATTNRFAVLEVSDDSDVEDSKEAHSAPSSPEGLYIPPHLRPGFVASAPTSPKKPKTQKDRRQAKPKHTPKTFEMFKKRMARKAAAQALAAKQLRKRRAKAYKWMKERKGE